MFIVFGDKGGEIAINSNNVTSVVQKEDGTCLLKIGNEKVNIFDDFESVVDKLNGKKTGKVGAF